MDRNELPNAQDVPGTPPSSGSALDSYRAAGDDDAALDAALAAAIAEKNAVADDSIRSH